MHRLRVESVLVLARILGASVEELFGDVSEEGIPQPSGDLFERRQQSAVGGAYVTRGAIPLRRWG